MDHSDHKGHMTGDTASDPHAAHRAMMNANRYTVREVAYTVPSVDLLDTSGTSVPLREVLDTDAPVALNFIFTTCTTICPIMTATFAQMQRHLGPAAEDLRLVSVSIDPEYDRPAVLKAYAEQFQATPNWIFLTGDSNDIAQVLRSFDSYTGSKMSHQPVTLLKRPGDAEWVRIDGLATGSNLATEVTARLLR